MRGSLNLDFILTLVIILVGTSSFFLLAYSQVENSAIAATQYKAEAMAMAIGSSINHFVAVQPGGNSTLILDFGGFESPDSPSPGELGFSLYVRNCSVTIDTISNLVVVGVLSQRMDSSAEEMIVASYPVTDLYSVAGEVNASCKGSIKVTTDTLENIPEVF